MDNVLKGADEYLQNEASNDLGGGSSFTAAGTTSPLTPLGQIAAHGLETSPGFAEFMEQSAALESKSQVQLEDEDEEMLSTRTLYENMAGETNALDILSGDMKAMVTAVNRLRAVGLEDLGLPLPRIAVIGNQSAGKSSLIEAISGITVPRYTGTCTRCPLEINLTENNDPGAVWTCKVSLRFQKRFDAKSRRIDPWVHQNMDIVQFMEIFEKAHVEEALIRAQTAILNPSRDWSHYATAPEGCQRNQKSEVKFSPNVVCMDISGPDLPNLAFIDLPGLIQATETSEEQYLIKLVRGLVESYIKQDDCLILLAITMKDDAVNQSALRMAKELGRGRTIGALTKPDTVLLGEHDQWVDILTGKSHELPHGYFVTKQPTQEQLSRTITHQEARIQEQAYFDTTEPWSTDLADFRPRFGTLNLQQYLSQQLISLIKLRLPEISERVKKEAFDVQAELESLPAPPASNTCLLLSHQLHKFEQNIIDLLDGSHLRNAFRSEWQKAAELLQKALRELRPRVNMNDRAALEPQSPFAMGKGSLGRLFSADASPSPVARRRLLGEPGEIPDATDEFFNSGSSRKRTANPFQTPSKRARTVENEDDDRESTVGPPNTTTDVPRSKPMHLEEIKSIIDSTATSRIPDSVDPRAIEALVKIHILLWKDPLETFVTSTLDLLHSHILETFNENFHRYRMSALYKRIPDILAGFLTLIGHKLDAIVTSSFKREIHNIITLNEEEMARERTNARAAFTNRRNNELEAQLAQKKASDDIRNKEQSGSGRKQRIDTVRPEVDKYVREIDTMAGVCAYTSIARRRFLDHVVMCVQGDIFFDIKQLMREYMETDLGMKEVNAEELCKQLMVEDPEKELRRRELLEKKEKLDNAWHTLRGFQNQI